MILVPRLTAVFKKCLPRARLRIVTVEHVNTTGYSESDVDLFVGVANSLPPGCETEVLFEDPIVLVVRRRHPMARRHVSLEDYARMSHLEVESGRDRDDSVDQHLATRGLSRGIAMTVPYFTAVPAVVAATNLVAPTTLGIATTFRHFQIQMLKPPFELPSVVLRDVWHRRVADDGRRARHGLRSAERRRAITPGELSSARVGELRPAPPGYVENEFRRYLEGGPHAHGFRARRLRGLR